MGNAELVIATTNSEGEANVRTSKAYDALDILVVDISTETGFVTVQCDDPSHMHGTDEANDTHDVMMVTFRNMAGEDVEVILPGFMGNQLAQRLLLWMEQLHDAGPDHCGCNEHEKE